MSTNFLQHEAWSILCGWVLTLRNWAATAWDVSRCLAALFLGWTLTAAEWLWQQFRDAEAWGVRMAGPVEESVRGEINRDELKRIVAKALLGLLTGEVASTREILANPDVRTIVLEPLLIGFVFGLVAYLQHKGEGKAGNADCGVRNAERTTIAK
jgi:hypothetical protein